MNDSDGPSFPAHISAKVSVAHRRTFATLLLAAMALLLFLTVGQLQGLTWQRQPEQGPDLGDAPDSDDNHHGMVNTAYPSPTFTVPISGHFPTVWEGLVPSGPRHEDISQVWLGEWATTEGEADLPPDQDGITNILPEDPTGGAILDSADHDEGDDGWLNRKVPLGNCRRVLLKVLVSKANAALEQPLYLNVWFDGNRDGDWNDIGTCDQQAVSSEWIVRNHYVDPGGIPNGGSRVLYVVTRLVMNEKPDLPSWMRFTLSNREAPHIPGTGPADGRGPDHPDQYELGETEDYYVEGFVGTVPPISLQKQIVLDNGELANEWHIVPGREIVYQLTLKSSDALTHTVHISDELPSGLVAGSAHATSGQVRIDNERRTVVWDGDIGPHNRPVKIWIHARLAHDAQCDERFGNKALWWTHFAKGESNEVWAVVRCHDLGDAPDSTNHYAATTMTAYPGVPAEFPTVWSEVPPEHGPLHRRPWPLHLGRHVSAEYDADWGPDVDGLNNLYPPGDLANRDRGDDSLELDRMGFAHCQYHRFPVWVYIDPPVITSAHDDRVAYINVWLDGDRNGTWADLHQCPYDPGPTHAPEHIVIDHRVPIGLLGPGLHRVWVETTGPVFWSSGAEAWLRVTLSEQKSIKLAGQSFGDGRGPAAGFALGETEDYALRPPSDPRPDVAVGKRVYLHPRYAHLSAAEWGPAWSVGWAIKYGNVGAASAHGVQIVDTYDTGGVPMPTVPAVYAVPPLPVVHAGQTFTFGVGTLLPGPGGHIAIRATLPYSTAPGTVLTNTVTISTPGDVNLSNNKAQVTATIPLLPPKILYPKPGTTCTGTFTVTGRVQPLPATATTPISVELYVDGSLHTTVAASLAGRWSTPVALSDGDHDLYAIAHYQGIVSDPSRHVPVTVDSTLPWSPISLRFVAQNGHVLWPRGRDGRMDETGWRVALRAGQTYTVSMYVCCSTAPTATLEIDGSVITLADPDADGWYEGSFTAPNPLIGGLRLCVICNLVQRCSDGVILIDPEGTVYDLDTGVELADATVTCLEQQEGGGGVTYTPWPAGDYGQENPQTTGVDGYYSFYTPPGTYRVGVTKGGYQPHLSGDLLVVDEPVHYDVHLAPAVTETADYTVTITALGFDPPILSVPPGSVIAWVNMDGDYHATTSVTPTMSSSGVAAAAVSDPWDSGLLDTGEVYVHRLTDGGTYTYQDGENGGIVGHVVVERMIYLPLVSRQYTTP